MSTWDPAKLGTGLVLSNGNLTVSASSGVSGVNGSNVIGTASKTSGKAYFEVTLSTVNDQMSIGVANASMETSGQQLGATANGVGFYPYYGSAFLSDNTLLNDYNTGAIANGDLASVAVDFDAKLIWFATTAMRNSLGSSAWNNSTSANPATGTGGVSFSALSGPWFVAFGDSVAGALVTLNVGATSFGRTIPSGYSGWDANPAPPSGLTAWDPARKGQVTLTNNNAQATIVPTGVIIVYSGTNGTFTDRNGGVWTISSSRTAQLNGSDAAFTANVAEIVLDAGGTVWHGNESSQFYSWNGSGWDAGPDPTTGVSPLSGQAVFSTRSKASGKYIVELDVSRITTNWACGVGSASFAAAGTELGNDGNGIGFYPAVGPGQSAWLNGVQVGGGGPTASSSGDRVTIALDVDARRVWVTTSAMRNASGAAAWNNTTSANPATGTGGFDISAVAAPHFLIFESIDPGASSALRTVGPFAVSAPSGFAAWDASTGADATINVAGVGAAPGITAPSVSTTAPGSINLTGVAASPGVTAPSASTAIPGAAINMTMVGVGAAPGAGAVSVLLSSGSLPATLRPDAVFFAADLETFRPGTVAINPAWGIGSRPIGTVELTATQPTDSGVIRSSDLGYRTRQTDPGGLVVYPPTLISAFQLNRQINVDPTAAENGVSSGWGNLTISNEDGALDEVSRTWNSDGRPVRLWWGRKLYDPGRGYLVDPSVTALALAFAGTAQPWALGEDGLSVPIRDISYSLERRLQKRQYDGSGQYGGDPDLAGIDMPMARGGVPFDASTKAAGPAIQNVTPVQLTGLVYQYTDGPGAVSAVYDGGAQVYAYAGDTTNIFAGSPAAGTYTTDNSRGLFRLGGPPVSQITCDVYGAFPIAGFVSNVFDLARYLLIEELDLQPEQLDLGSFALATATYPYDAGAFWDASQGISAVGALDWLLSAVGAKLVPLRDGRLRVVTLRAAPINAEPQGNLDTTNIVDLQPAQLPQPLDPPPYRFRVGYLHNYTVQTSGYLGAATQTRRTFVAQADRYSTWVSTGVLQSYRRPQDPPPINGALLRKGDAQAVANDLGALWGVSQRAFQVSCPAEAVLNLDLGDFVNITFPVSDLASGQLAQIVGDRLNSEDNEVTYTVIGLRSRTVALPGPVRNLALVRNTDTQIDVRWDPVAASGVRYQVMYRVAG